MRKCKKLYTKSIYIAMLCAVLLVMQINSTSAHAFSETMSAKIQFLTPVSISQSQPLILGPIKEHDGIQTYSIKANGMKQNLGQSAVYKIMGNGRASVSYSCDTRKVSQGVEIMSVKLSSYSVSSLDCTDEVYHALDTPDAQGEMLAVGMTIRMNGKKAVKEPETNIIQSTDIILYTHYD